MPLFPRFVPMTSNTGTMDLNTLLSLLASQEPQADHHSYYNQSPSHSSPSNASHHAPEANKERVARSAGPAPVVRAFTPNFDILETPQAYILEGELPGLSDKKAIDIEFTDHQTLMVKGRIEKVPLVVPVPTATATEAPAQVKAKEIDEKPHQEHEEPPRPRSPLKPTVEDDVDEDDDGFSTIVMTPTTTSSTAATEAPKKKTMAHPKPTTPPVRYWVSERSIGAFQRSFSFPGLIDQDNVTAKLEHGILTIVVPKRSKIASKKIQID